MCGRYSKHEYNDKIDENESPKLWLMYCTKTNHEYWTLKLSLD